MKSILYCHSPFSLTSFASIEATASLPIIVAATIAGPIPPASRGFGIHAESPTSMYPFATRQSFCLLTETCHVPVVLTESLGSSESRGFLIALLSLPCSFLLETPIRIHLEQCLDLNV